MSPKIQMRTKKASFTLLELMVCLAIIGLLAAVLGVKGIDLLSHHRFHSCLQSWLLDLQKAQLLSMNQGVDVVCTLSKHKDGGYESRFESDCPSFAPSKHVLKEVSCLYFENRSFETLEITLFSSGRISPQGLLKIEPKKEGEDIFYLDLFYPIAFQLTSHRSFVSLIPPFYPEKRGSSGIFMGKALILRSESR